MTHRILTIGYEGVTQEEVLTALARAGTTHLLDVRWTARSRKKGLSKTALGIAAGELGISYSHDRRLGTPPEMLKQARRNGYEFDLYRDYLLTEQEALDDAASLAASEAVALMCYEADINECHRLIVSEELAVLTGANEISHLQPSTAV